MKRLTVSIACVGLCLAMSFASSRDASGGGWSNACQRPAAGSVVRPPPDLYSQAGILNVALSYLTRVDDAGRTLFCFETQDGLQSPTLHVKPGDTLNIMLTNHLPDLPAGRTAESMSSTWDVCGADTMTAASVNIHFHGTNTRPVCHADEAIRTLVNSGQTFRYSVTFPRDEPPGLYWYHPHVHGISEAAVLGGATGAIIVEGIESLQPAVIGIKQRVLILRDQPVVGNSDPSGSVPSWDLTLNYVPIAYPDLTPSVIEIQAEQQEFWRVANTSADTVADLRLSYDGVSQPLEVVAIDGVPTGSQDGTRRGKAVVKADLLLPPAGRAEFIVTAPPAGVRQAILETLSVDTGPDGDNDTRRTLAVLRTGEPVESEAKPADPNAHVTQTTNPGEDAVSMPVPGRQRFEAIDAAPINAARKLYFSEVLSDPSNPASPTDFYITVDGATPRLFAATNPPAITTTQGHIEEWTIENRTGEVHEFHIHQIHFQLHERNHMPVPPEDRQFMDTIQVPYWSGTGPYPSVTIALDFRGKIVGDFVYHCHILGHEDNGMMAIIRVLPAPG